MPGSHLHAYGQVNEVFPPPPRPQLRAWMYAVYGALAVVGTMGPWYLLLLFGHCVGHYVASLLGQPWLCLGLGMASLASFKLDPLISWQVCNREGQGQRGQG